MSIFEAFMLVCFGVAWPLSIWRSFRSRRNDGKSVWFLLVVFVGYVSGTIHKFMYNLDGVVILYMANGVMVAIDSALYLRNKRLMRGEGREPQALS